MSDHLLEPEISIIIISYNTRDMTLACLSSVFEQTHTAIEVIVVDNCSSDGSAEEIANNFPTVNLIAAKENHGFGPAHNIALERSNAPWLLLLNPDTVVLNYALDNLLSFAKRTPKAGIWGGRTVFADGSLNKSSCWNRTTFWSTLCRTTGLSVLFPKSQIFNSEEIGDWPRDTERNVDIVTGCLFLIKRKTWDELGGFDPIFSMYGEEVDLCLRAQKAGFRPRITPDATIIHYGAASDSIRADKMVRLMRAKIELIKRHFPTRTRWMVYKTFYFWPLTRALGYQMFSKITRKNTLRKKSDEWWSVWNRRSEWEKGLT